MRILPIVIFNLVLVILYPTSVALCRWYDRNRALRRSLNMLLDSRVDDLLDRLQTGMRRRAAVRRLMNESAETGKIAVVVYLHLLYLRLAYLKKPQNIVKDTKWLIKTGTLSVLPPSRG